MISKIIFIDTTKKTGISIKELNDPTPNMEAIKLIEDRLDWFFDKFCHKPELTKERDGKVAVELLIKAIQKTLDKCKGGAPFNLIEEAYFVGNRSPALKAGLYDLSYAGAKKYQEWCETFARALLRGLKPGACICVFNSTKQFHRLANHQGYLC